MIYRFNLIVIKIPARLFIDIDKITPKLMWKGRGTRIAKTILQKGEESSYLISR